MPRILLLLPSSTYRAADFLAAARRLGVDVVVACEEDQALAGRMPHPPVVVDFAAPEEAASRMATAVAALGVDAVVAVDDQGLEAAGHAAEALGLAHNPLDALAATRDKALLRRCLDAAGVVQPAWLELPPLAEPGGTPGLVPLVEHVIESVGLPCVVKPRGLSGSRGVIRADDPAALEAALARSAGIAEVGGGGGLLAEAYVPGGEVALEALLADGRLEVLALFDKPDPLEGPFFAETIYVTPSRLPAPVQDASAERVGAACAALGLRSGPVHAELRITPDGTPVLLEVAARTIGGRCSRALDFATGGSGVTGCSLEELVLRNALGNPPPGPATLGSAAGVLMLPVPVAGVLRGVSGVEAASALPGIVGVELTIAAGRRVAPLPEGDRYLGFVFARGAGPAAVEEALRRAWAELDVLVDPVPADAAVAV